MVPVPPTTPGYEGIPIPIGPKLATLANAATGQTVDGVQCQANEQLVSHVHTHLTVFVNGKARVIPYGIGIPGAEAVATPHGAFVETGSCFYWLHSHQEDGVVHVESPSTALSFTLGPVLQDLGAAAELDAGGPGDREAHGVLHRTWEEGGDLQGESGRPAARQPLPDSDRRRNAGGQAGPDHQLGQSVARCTAMQSSSDWGPEEKR